MPRADGGGWEGGGERVFLPGSGPEKVLPNPTWAVFAVSGLAAWLNDNWLCTRPFAFVLMFIPTGDISSVRCCPYSASQAGMLGWVLGTAFVQPLKNSGWRERGQDWAQEMPGLEGPLGYRVRKEGGATTPISWRPEQWLSRGAAATSPLQLEQRARRARPTVSALEAGVKA